MKRLLFFILTATLTTNAVIAQIDTIYTPN